MYPQLPIVPETPSSSDGNLNNNWCRWNLSLEAEHVKDQNGQCKLMGQMLLECADMELGRLVKDNLGAKHPILPRYGLGPCVDAKNHVGYCVLKIQNISTADFAPDGELVSCGDWVATTECNGMKAGYDMSKGDKHGECSPLKRINIPNPLQVLQRGE